MQGGCCVALPAAPREGRPPGRLARRCCSAATGMNTGEEKDEAEPGPGEVIEAVEAVELADPDTCWRLNGGRSEEWRSGPGAAPGLRSSMLWAEIWERYQVSR